MTLTKTKAVERRRPFRPRARLLQLLGDQLIRSPGIAAFELAKNAYDADARHFTLTLLRPEDKEHGEIIAEDDGSGMTWETVTGVWLERERSRLSSLCCPIRQRPSQGYWPGTEVPLATSSSCKQRLSGSQRGRLQFLIPG